MRTLLRCVIVVWLVCAVGCGARTATVSGTVKLGKQPLTGCTVALYCSDQQILHTRTDERGQFVVNHVPAGPVRVTVQARRQLALEARGAAVPPPLPNGDGPIPPLAAPSDPTVTVPVRYAHPEESGLAFVADGPQVSFDISLAP